MGDISQMQEQIRNFCADRDWDKFHNLKDLIISLNLESAEVLEHVQWKNDDELEKLKFENQELGEELADVLYWTILTANKANIDLSKAFAVKMGKNAAKYPVSKSRGTQKKYTELK